MSTAMSLGSKLSSSGAASVGILALSGNCFVIESDLRRNTDKFIGILIKIVLQKREQCITTNLKLAVILEYVMS